MRRPMTSCILLLAACGARLSSNPEDEHGSFDAGAGAVGGDAGAPDAPPADAAPLGPWSAPAAVTVAATTAVEDDVTLSSNALEMVYAITDPDTGRKDLYYTSRPAIGAAWTPAAKLPFDRDASSEESPRFSADDKTLYFASDRAANDGNLDIYSASHAATATVQWGPAQRVTPLTTAVDEKWLSPCQDGHYVVVETTTAGDTDLFEGMLGSAASPTPITGLNTTASETGAFLSADCLTLYFASFRVMPERIFVSHRASVGAPWQPAVRVDDFKIGAGTDAQEDPWMSADGRTFALASNAVAAGKDIYLSTR